MQYTVAAVFEKQFQAKQAFNDLLESGFRADELHLRPEDDLDASQPSTPYEEEEEEDSLISRAASTIADVFDDEDDDEVSYPEAEAGNYVLTVDVSDDNLVEKATEVLDKYDPIDIEESIVSSPQGLGAGSPTPESKSTLAPPESSIEGEAIYPSSSRPTNYDGAYATAIAAEEAVPREGDLSADEAYAQQSDALSDDNAIDNLSGTRDNDLSALAGEEDEDDEAYFRQHWDGNYSASGNTYEDFAHAYRFGSYSASNQDYQGRSWDDIEPTLQRDWQESYPESAWEQFKNAIRTGWDRVTS
jgi:hypothetical protein